MTAASIDGRLHLCSSLRKALEDFEGALEEASDYQKIERSRAIVIFLTHCLEEWDWEHHA